MLTGLKLLSLACRCIFYRPEHNAMGGFNELDFRGLKIQKWNIPVEKAQRVDEKNSVICLVIFTPGVMVIKMPKMTHFLYFLLITGFFCWLSSFLILLSSKGNLNPNHIKHTIFWKNSIRSFRCPHIFCPKSN